MCSNFPKSLQTEPLEGLVPPSEFVVLHPGLPDLSPCECYVIVSFQVRRARPDSVNEWLGLGRAPNREAWLSSETTHKLSSPTLLELWVQE